MIKAKIIKIRRAILKSQIAKKMNKNKSQNIYKKYLETIRIKIMKIKIHLLMTCYFTILQKMNLMKYGYKNRN